MTNRKDAQVKPPKQWRHWCAGQHLRQQGKKTHQSDWFYLVGRGHHWRVNCKGMFQRGDNYADFDRWARCEISECPMPTTRQAFREAIKALLESTKAHHEK